MESGNKYDDKSHDADEKYSMANMATSHKVEVSCI
jgi:hypothetical protein